MSLSMSMSAASSLLTDGGQSEIEEGPNNGTVISEHSASSNRVMVEQIFPQHDGRQQTVCLLPESGTTLLSSPLKGHCCTAKIYTVNLRKKTFSQSTEAELSAFLSEIDQNGNHLVELCCNPGDSNDNNKARSYFRFEFEDEIRKVQLLPLPISTSLRRETTCDSYTTTFHQTIGVLLVVVSKRAGVSVHSIVLARKSTGDPFHMSEFLKATRGTVEDTGPTIEISAYLDNTRDEDGRALAPPDPVLYVAILPINPLARSHRMDALACPMVNHKSALFRFGTRGPTRALKRSLVLIGVGCAKGVSIVAKRNGSGFPSCTLAALFGLEMKIVRLPSLDRWTKQVLKPEDISTVQFSEQGLGTPSMVVPMIGENHFTHLLPVKFAVFCGAKEPSDDDVSTAPQTSSFSTMPSDASLSSAASKGRGPPPQWTAAETRNAVLRARRDIMSNVLATLHGENAVQKSLHSQPNFSEMALQTPKGKTLLSSDESTISDENLFDITIPSPDTAILDMSGKWMSRNLSESSSSGSVLAGLGYADQDDDSTVMTFRSKERLFHAPSPEETESQSSAYIAIISLSEKSRDGSSNTVTTKVHRIPTSFPVSFECICMKSTTTKLLLAAQASSSLDAHVLSIPMERGEPTVEVANLEPLQIAQAHRNQHESHVKGLDLETTPDGGILIRVIGTRPTSHGPVGSDRLSSFFVNIETSSACQTVNKEADTSIVGSVNDTLVVEKLENIMRALLRFESNVDDRLNLIEKRMEENSIRLSRLEMKAATRFEI